MAPPIIYGAGIPHVTVPHFLALAEEAPKHAAIGQFSTYKGHSPTPDRAWDIFPKNGSFEEGDKLARWLVRPEVMAHFGIDYRIWSFNRRTGSIFNPEVAPHEREMRDRGSPTQNHVDHNHVSANAKAPAVPDQGDGDLTKDEHDALARIDKDTDDLDARMHKAAHEAVLNVLRAPEFHLNGVNAYVAHLVDKALPEVVTRLEAIEKKIGTGGGVAPQAFTITGEAKAK